MPERLLLHENITVGATTARNSTALAVGCTYRVVSTTACWVLQGGSAVEASSTTGAFLPADTVIEVRPRSSSEAYIAVIQDAAAGTLNIARVEH